MRSWIALANGDQDLQGIGGEDLIKIMVQIAADNDVEAADLSEMICRCGGKFV